MPITLGCPACGKRFKARDESAGKRVKCPYCGAPVTVPTPEESAAAGAPTMALPPPPAPARPSPLAGSAPLPVPPARSSAPAAPPGPAAVATPDDWGAEPPPLDIAKPIAVAPAPPVEEPPPFPKLSRSESAVDKLKKEAKPRPPERSARSAPPRDAEAKTPEQLAAPGWRKARGGLFWVLFGLFFLALPGFIGFAKTVLPRTNIEIPRGEGWSIPGYINSPETPGAVKMNKEDQIDYLAYATPVLIAGFALSFGRLTSGAAPRNSGAKGMFAFSGLFTFLAFACLVTWGVCELLLFDVTKKQAALGAIILGGTAELWFLTGLAAAGVALKRPKAARAVGVLIFFVALAAAAATLGWDLYKQEWRPRTLDMDWKLYEQAALMIGWLLLIGLYWRAVSSVRVAIRDFLETVEE